MSFQPGDRVKFLPSTTIRQLRGRGSLIYRRNGLSTEEVMKTTIFVVESVKDGSVILRATNGYTCTNWIESHRLQRASNLLSKLKEL